MNDFPLHAGVRNEIKRIYEDINDSIGVANAWKYIRLEGLVAKVFAQRCEMSFTGRRSRCVAVIICEGL